MTTPAQLRPYWRRVLDGEEPVFHDGYSGHDWAEEQRDAYWEALRQAADAIDKRDEELERYRRVVEAAGNLMDYRGASIRATWPDIADIWHELSVALAALDKEVCTGFANNCRCPPCTQRAISDAGMDDQEAP